MHNSNDRLMRRILHVRIGLRSALALLLLAIACAASAAIDPALVKALALGENDAKVDAIAKLVASADPAALQFLESLQAGEVQTAGERVLRVKDDQATDLITGERITPLRESRDDIILNNRVRREIETAVAALRLFSPDVSVRREAAKTLQNGADEAMLPVIKKAVGSEKQADIH